MQRLAEFAPAIDEYLKTHLFGAILGRDNLDWPSREPATVGARAALDKVARDEADRPAPGWHRADSRHRLLPTRQPLHPPDARALGAHRP